MVSLARARLALFAVTVIVYACALTSPFVFDDLGVLDTNAVHSLPGLVADLGRGLRPVLKASYALCWALGGSALVFHTFNLVVHLLNVELVFRLAKIARSTWPMVPTVLFALHPIQSEAVTYVSGRSSSLSTLFMLLALLFHARGGRARLVAVPLAVLFAVFAKETSLVMPIGLFLWDLFLAPTDSPAPVRLRVALRRQLPWALLGAGIFFVMIAHSGYYALLYRVVGQRPLREALLYQLAAMRYLAGRLFLLGRPCIDPGLWLAPSPWAIGLGTAWVLLLVACIVHAYRGRARGGDGLVGFGLAWYLLHAFVPYVLVSRLDVINERHTYVADAGLFLAAGALIARVRTAEWVRRAVAVSALVVLSSCTVRRNLEYRSTIELWTSTVREAPKNPRAWNNLGVEYERAGDRGLARAHYTRALALDPRFVPAREHLSRLGAL